MPEKDISPGSAPVGPAAAPAEQQGSPQPGEAGGTGTETATFSHKVKGLVDDFVDYAKKADL